MNTIGCWRSIFIMAYIIYNCGYARTLKITTKAGNTYAFERRFVTEVKDEDESYFLNKTSKDISWCPANDRSLLPFMTLEDWCAGKEGRFSIKPFQKYDPKGYLSEYLLK